MRRTGSIALLLVALLQGLAHAQETPGSRAIVTPQWFTGVNIGYQNFFGDIQAWQDGSVSLGRKSAEGTFIVRGNYARHFGTTGYQAEADAYPRIADGVYAYLNLGYSQSSAVFAEWRSGAEVFTRLPNAYEASLGYRQLRFNGSPVTLFTGAVGKYQGNYWFSLRPYVRTKRSGTSASGSLLARRYYEDGDHYLGARIGFGSTPSDDLSPEQAVLRTNAFTAELQGSTSLAATVLGIWSATYEYEQLTALSSRNSIAFNLGARVFF